MPSKQPTFEVNSKRCRSGILYIKCHYFQPVDASISTRRLGKTVMEALRETIENLWGAALQGWVAFVLATIFPEMDSRLGVDYNGARFLSHALSLEKKREGEQANL